MRDIEIKFSENLKINWSTIVMIATYIISGGGIVTTGMFNWLSQKLVKESNLYELVGQVLLEISIITSSSLLEINDEKYPKVLRIEFVNYFKSKLENQNLSKDFFTSGYNDPLFRRISEGFIEFITENKERFNLSDDDLKKLLLKFPESFDSTVKFLYLNSPTYREILEKISKAFDYPIGDYHDRSIKLKNYQDFLLREVDDSVYDESLTSNLIDESGIKKPIGFIEGCFSNPELKLLVIESLPGQGKSTLRKKIIKKFAGQEKYFFYLNFRGKYWDVFSSDADNAFAKISDLFLEIEECGYSPNEGDVIIIDNFDKLEGLFHAKKIERFLKGLSKYNGLIILFSPKGIINKRKLFDFKNETPDSIKILKIGDLNQNQIIKIFSINRNNDNSARIDFFIGELNSGKFLEVIKKDLRLIKELSLLQNAIDLSDFRIFKIIANFKVQRVVSQVFFRNNFEKLFSEKDLFEIIENLSFVVELLRKNKGEEKKGYIVIKEIFDKEFQMLYKDLLNLPMLNKFLNIFIEKYELLQLFGFFEVDIINNEFILRFNSKELQDFFLTEKISKTLFEVGNEQSLGSEFFVKNIQILFEKISYSESVWNFLKSKYSNKTDTEQHKFIRELRDSINFYLKNQSTHSITCYNSSVIPSKLISNSFFGFWKLLTEFSEENFFLNIESTKESKKNFLDSIGLICKLSSAENLLNLKWSNFNEIGHVKNLFLGNTDFSFSVFSNSEFFNVSFKNCKFNDTNFVDSKFHYCDFSESEFEGNLFFAEFNRCNFTKTKFSNGKISFCEFYSCDLNGIQFHEIELEYTDFKNSSLTNIDFRDVKSLEIANILECSTLKDSIFDSPLRNIISNHPLIISKLGREFTPLQLWSFEIVNHQMLIESYWETKEFKRKEAKTEYVKVMNFEDNYSKLNLIENEEE